jgi:hypothetical protein
LAGRTLFKRSREQGEDNMPDAGEVLARTLFPVSNLFNWSKGQPSVYTPPTTSASQVGGGGYTFDPNAPLSSLLSGAGQSQKNYEEGFFARKKPSDLLQYQSGILGRLGIQNTDIGTSMLGVPLDYWQNLLKTPTRQGLLEETAPAVSSVVGQYSTGKKSLTQLPRGGGTSATLANLPFQESGAITGLLEQQLEKKLNVIQPMAAEAITGIANSLSSMGLSELGLSSQSLATLIGKELAKSGQSAQALGEAGKGVGEIIAALLMAA